MNKLSIGLPSPVLCSAVFAHGQGPNEGFVMEGEGTRHLLSHAEPIYPPIAKAAHVQGSVLLHADVDETRRCHKSRS